jgi:hypothetical protein
MLIAAAGVLITAFVALAFVGVADARIGVRRLERELDMQPSGAEMGYGKSAVSLANKLNALEEARFSASLAALSKVQQSTVRNSPEPVLDESSSLVSVPLVQSKSQPQVS